MALDKNCDWNKKVYYKYIILDLCLDLALSIDWGFEGQEKSTFAFENHFSWERNTNEVIKYYMTLHVIHYYFYM